VLFRNITATLALLASLALSGCGVIPNGGPDPATQAEIAELTRGIMAMGPGIDPEEAARAARISYEQTYRLALEYEITDPPLIHNAKVNAGLRPRGLCWHWAEDMENRLNDEDFQTLEMHRAIANADSNILIDHSTAIISRRGDSMDQGVVLDPWRKGGTLFWSPLLEDTRYVWVPREQVLDARRRQMIAEGLIPASG
jgi:hypothetical protein